MTNEVDKKYSANLINELSLPLKLDFLAVFKELERDVAELINKAQSENWYVDELIQKIEDLI